jgi:WD40 repeat protein
VAGGDADRWIVSAGADATLRLWSAGSGALVRTIELKEGPVTALAVDGRRALAGHKGGIVVLWDLEHGEKLATIRHGTDTDTIVSLAFIGATDAFAAARQDGTVALFQLGAPAAAGTLLDGQGSGGPILAAAPSHGVIVSGGFDGTVRLWRTEGPSMVRTWRHGTSDLAAIDISPDGAQIAGGRDDGIVLVWPSASQRSRGVRRLKAHDGRITAVALGPEGTLATAGEDGRVKLWNLHPEPSARALGLGRVQALSFSRDGRRLYGAGQDGVVRVWSLAAPTTVGAL